MRESTSAAIDAYRITYHQTRSDLLAFNAAAEAYLALHPGESEQCARLAVSQEIALAVEEMGPERYWATG